ncbi:Group II intron-encoded protein LtrA [Streptomyces antimycoticus]
MIRATVGSNYCRYADDWLLGFTGPKREAEEIKADIGRFLHDELKLELSEEKTPITHGRTSAARFLGYEIVVLDNDTKHDQRGHRSINAQIGLNVPADVIRAKCRLYMHHGRPIRRTERTVNSDFSIVAQYQAEFRGIAGYYQLAFNLHRLGRLKYATSAPWSRRCAEVPRPVSRIDPALQYRAEDRPGSPPGTPGHRRTRRRTTAVGGAVGRSLAEAQDQDRQPRRSPDAGVEQRAQRSGQAPARRHLRDVRVRLRVEAHHRHLKDLNVRAGLQPAWAQMMAARRRKTLVVCRVCHEDIHYGASRSRQNS